MLQQWQDCRRCQAHHFVHLAGEVRLVGDTRGDRGVGE